MFRRHHVGADPGFSEEGIQPFGRGIKMSKIYPMKSSSDGHGGGTPLACVCDFEKQAFQSLGIWLDHSWITTCFDFIFN